MFEKYKTSSMIENISGILFYIILFGTWFYTGTDDYTVRFGKTDPAFLLAMVFGGLCGLGLIASTVIKAISAMSFKGLEWEIIIMIPAVIWFIYMLFTH